MTGEINMVFLNELYRTQNIVDACKAAGIGFRTGKNMIASAQRRGIMIKRAKFESAMPDRGEKSVEFDITIMAADESEKIDDLRKMQELICGYNSCVAIRNGTITARITGNQETIDQFYEEVSKNPLVVTAFRKPGQHWTAPITEKRRARGKLVKYDAGYKIIADTEQPRDLTIDEFPVLARRVPFAMLDGDVITLPDFITADLLTLNSIYKGCNSADMDGEGNDRINKLIGLLADGKRHDASEIAEATGVKIHRIPYLIKKTRAMRGRNVIKTRKADGMCLYEKGGINDKG